MWKADMGGERRRRRRMPGGIEAFLLFLKKGEKEREMGRRVPVSFVRKRDLVRGRQLNFGNFPSRKKAAATTLFFPGLKS